MGSAAVGRLLQWSRKRAGITQQELAAATGVPQPNIARIERGRVSPRTATLITLLEATGHELAVERRIGATTDRAPIRERLRLVPPPRRTQRSLPNPETTRVLRRLRRFGVRFVLIGELAEVVHGSPTRIGEGVEVCHSQDPESLERLATALRDLGAGVDPAELRQELLTARTDAADLRLIAHPLAGVGYEMLVRTARKMLVDVSLLVHVAAIDDLIQIRRVRGTPTDLQALEILGALRDELSDE